MSTIAKFTLINELVTKNAIEAIRNSPHGSIVEIKNKKRSNMQNAIFHALCGDLAKDLEFAGKKRSLESWKALLISGHAIATGNQGEVVAGLEGELVAIRESSAQMGVSRMNSLIEYSIAFATQNGVKLRDVKYDNYFGELR